MNSWLIVAHISDTFEINDFKKIFKKVQKQLSENTDIYVIYVYVKKRGKIIHITNQTYDILKHFNQKNNTQTEWCNKMLNYVLKITKPVAMTYYGHGGGLVIGPWIDPWMSLKKFNDIFIKKVKPEILCFDSCYLGSIVTLYEIQKNVKLVLASPSWHPYTSVSSLKLFGNLPNYTKENKTNVFKKYLVDMSCEFSTIKGQPKYTCLVAFDLTNLNKIIKKIKKIELIKDNNLNLHDPKGYDLLKSVEPNVSKELSTIVLSKKCMSKCPITIQGPSVSYQSKNSSFNKYYINSKWGKFTKTINIIHEE